MPNSDGSADVDPVNPPEFEIIDDIWQDIISIDESTKRDSDGSENVDVSPENNPEDEENIIVNPELPVGSENDEQSIDGIDIALPQDTNVQNQLKTKFQSMIEVSATLIVFAGRLLCATFINLFIFLGITTIYLGIGLVLVEIISRIYYFFNSDSTSAGWVGDIASFFGGAIISFAGNLISLLGEFVQSLASNAFCQGGLIIAILIITLSKWAKIVGKEMLDFNTKSFELMKRWWNWAYAPLYVFQDGHDEEE